MDAYPNAGRFEAEQSIRRQAGATVAQMLTPLKAAMDALAPGGKLVLVIRGADSDSQFKRHARAAEVLDLKTSAIELTALRARGLIITR